MNVNNFNKLAKVYDGLAHIVFGDAIKKSQRCFLDTISANNKILILGGGTGWILNELESLNISLGVTYIDASISMIKSSQQRGPFDAIYIDFIHGTEDDIPAIQYDVIITNFFLDVFNRDELSQVLYKLNQNLKKEGTWIVTDFVQTGWWQNLLIKMMYIFFKWTVNLSGYKLLKFEKHLGALNRVKYKHKRFFHGMIESAIYH